MGNKTHPKAMRLGYTAEWESKWFSLREMPALIGEDFKIRNLVKRTFRMAAVSWVGIERAGSYLRVNIHTARPGVVIGKRGADIEGIRAQIESLTQRKTFINVVEIKDPELDSRLVAEAVAIQLEKRIAYRRAMRRSIERSIQSGALGIKIMVSGRLNGSEIARREWAREGRVPLHTFSADVDWAKQNGAHIERFNLAQQPMAFAGNAVVKGLLERSGEGALPVILLDGELALAGRYPSRDELARWAGIETALAPAAVGSCCSGGRCCG